jgi:hypothetical protein
MDGCDVKSLAFSYDRFSLYPLDLKFEIMMICWTFLLSPKLGHF